jgi:hypothetical protein
MPGTVQYPLLVIYLDGFEAEPRPHFFFIVGEFSQEISLTVFSLLCDSSFSQPQAPVP